MHGSTASTVNTKWSFDKSTPKTKAWESMIIEFDITKPIPPPANYYLPPRAQPQQRVYRSKMDLAFVLN